MNILNADEILKTAKDIQGNFQFQSKLQVIDQTVATTSSGNPYFIMKLGDLTDSITNVKKWTNSTEEFNYYSKIFEIGNILEIKGEYQEKYHSAIINDVRKLNSDEFDLEDFLKLPELNEQKLYNDLSDTISNINNKFMKELLNKIFSEKNIKELFLECPSSILYHHPYKCGNLEHTMGMIMICKTYEEFYQRNTELDLDLIYTGIILHDIGKIFEYKINNGLPSLNKDYALLSHINLGDQIVTEYIKKIDNFPQDIENRIRHIILSHHGRKEWGSPIEPQFPEAEIIHYIYMIDSRFKSTL